MATDDERPVTRVSREAEVVLICGRLRSLLEERSYLSALDSSPEANANRKSSLQSCEVNLLKAKLMNFSNRQLKRVFIDHAPGSLVGLSRGC